MYALTPIVATTPTGPPRGNSNDMREDTRTHRQNEHHNRRSEQFPTFITTYDPSSPDDDTICQDILLVRCPISQFIVRVRSPTDIDRGQRVE